jgi:hypothetical protein
VEQMMTKKMQRAVILYLEQVEGGFSIVMDDVCQDRSGLRRDVHVTKKQFTDLTWDELSFSESELAEFGYYIIARLNAFRVRDEF